MEYQIFVKTFVFKTGEGAYCTIIKNNEHEKIIIDGKNKTTKYEMELRGVIDGIINIIDSNETKVYTSFKAIEKQLKSLKKVSIIEVKYTDLWIILLDKLESINIEIEDLEIENEKSKETFLKALDYAIKLKEKKLLKLKEKGEKEND